MVAQALALLAAHADLIEEIVEAIQSGATKDALRDAIRAVKAQVSDAAVKEELFK